MLLARISPTLSCYSSLSSIAPSRPSKLHHVPLKSCCRYILVGRPTLARLCEGVHRSTSLMSSSLLLQKCPACLVHIIWMVFEMDGWSVTTKQSVDDNIYAPPWGLSTLPKEFTAAARIMQSSSNELSTLVSSKV